ncbi:MAG TPA: hypothetical protein VIJ25_02620, partial [Methylococcales bacterium]
DNIEIFYHSENGIDSDNFVNQDRVIVSKIEDAYKVIGHLDGLHNGVVGGMIVYYSVQYPSYTVKTPISEYSHVVWTGWPTDVIPVDVLTLIITMTTNGFNWVMYYCQSENYPGAAYQAESGSGTVENDLVTRFVTIRSSAWNSGFYATGERVEIQAWRTPWWGT